MKRTAHEFAEIYKQGNHFVMKLRNGKFAEISTPTTGSFVQIGGEYDNAREAMDATAPRQAKFFADKVLNEREAARHFASIGGKARAKKLSAERRKEIARSGGLAKGKKHLTARRLRPIDNVTN